MLLKNNQHRCLNKYLKESDNPLEGNWKDIKNTEDLKGKIGRFKTE